MNNGGDIIRRTSKMGSQGKNWDGSLDKDVCPDMQIRASPVDGSASENVPTSTGAKTDGSASFHQTSVADENVGIIQDYKGTLSQAEEKGTSVKDEGKALVQDEEEPSGFPLWVKWRGKWQAGIRCALSDCPSATLKAMPTYDRKTYIVIYFPNTRSHFWADSQLACAISEKPVPLAFGTHESGRELVKDPTTPRRYMLQKLAVSMLDASDKLHVEAVVESARNVGAWKEFAKEAAKCTSYTDLGRMILKLHSMILENFISSSWKETFHTWKERCEHTKTASQSEELINELMDAILWEDVGKLWEVPIHLGEEWKTWKKEVMKLFSTSNPLISSTEKNIDRDTKEEHMTTCDSLDHISNPESSRKRQKLEIRRGMSSDGKDAREQPSSVYGLFSTPSIPNSTGHQLLQQSSLSKVPSQGNELLKNYSKARDSKQCSAFIERKGRTCSKWAVEGGLYCTKHSAVSLTENATKSEQSAPSSAKADMESELSICHGMTIHGRRCTHRTRNGTQYCLKHMVPDSQNSEMANGTPSSSIVGGNPKRTRLSYEGDSSSNLGNSYKKEAISGVSSLKANQNEQCLSESKVTSKAANWSRCIGTLRNHGGQCSHRAKPGSSYCEKHQPVVTGASHLYNPSLLNGIFKMHSEEESNANDLLNEYMNMRLKEGSPDSGDKAMEWIVGKVQNINIAEELLKEVISEKRKLVKLYNFQERQVNAIPELQENIVSSSARTAILSDGQPADDMQSLESANHDSSAQFLQQECRLCCQTFSDLESLSNHYLDIHRKEVEWSFKGYACKHCVSSFTNKKGLERHVKIHHNNVSFEQCSECCCISCDRRFEDVKLLGQHVVAVHSELLNKCIADRDQPSTKHLTSLHMEQDVPSSSKQETGLGPGYRPTSENDERKMLVTYDDPDVGEKRTFVRNGVKKFTCRFCGMKFSLLPDLGRHHQARHKGFTTSAHKDPLKNRKELFASKWRANGSNTRTPNGCNASLGARRKRMKRLDFRRSARVKAKSLRIEENQVLGNFTESQCAAIADMLLSEGQKIRPSPSNLEILNAARIACCRIKFCALLEEKYGKLPERLYIKAAKVCSEESVIIEWHREGYVCPKGCIFVDEKASLLSPLPDMHFDSHIASIKDVEKDVECNSLKEVFDKTESHLVLNSFSLGKTFQEKKILLEDLSFGQEPEPIPCVIDEDVLNTCNANESLKPWESFCYTTKRRLDPSLGLDTKSSQLGCACTGKQCASESCDHVYLFDNDYENAEDIFGEPMRGRFPYDENGRIILERGLLVYECNSLCKCDLDCQNRVLQRGVRVKLEVFKTRQKGWAVRAAEPIPRGTFICEYSGEVLNDQEADVRGKRYDRHGCSYLYDIDPHIDVNDFMEDIKPYVIDATEYGNVARFINHSCSPNLVNYQVLVESMDCQLAHIGLYASRDIAIGEELAYDYHYKLLPGNGVQCLCGADNCRGRLY